MKLSEEQSAIVKGWAAEGATLNDIQKRLKEELDIGLTYLETRFLISDLELNLRDPKAEEKAKAAAKEAAKAAEAAEAAIDGDPEDAEPGGFPDEASPDGGGVTVTADTIAQPGMMVSGKVTFSDGQIAQWYFDQMGQLGLVPEVADYQPSEPDIAAFQRQLRQVLQRSGMA